jgi:hypothetical protein
MCPHKFKRGGGLSTLATPPRVGPKTLANPKPTGVGKTGVQGALPPGRGPWGMCPQKFKRGGGLSTLATPPRVGPKTLANPKPTGVGKTGVQGALPPGRGPWGMCPQKFKRGGGLSTLATPPRVGPKTLANPKPTGVGKTGVQGAQAPWQGALGDVPPKP